MNFQILPRSGERASEPAERANKHDSVRGKIGMLLTKGVQSRIDSDQRKPFPTRGLGKKKKP